MRKINSLFLALCCLFSLNIIAFADTTIKCPECDRSIPEDSNHCCYCGVLINSKSSSSETSSISQTPLAIFEGCDNVDQVLINAEKAGLLPNRAYSSELFDPNNPGSYSVGYKEEFMGIEGSSEFFMYCVNGFEHIDMSWTSVDKLSSTQSRKVFDEAVSYLSTVFGEPVSESSSKDFASAHWEDTDYMEYGLSRDYDNSIKFYCNYDYPVDKMFRTDSVTEIQSLMQKGMSWSEYANQTEDIIKNITIN